MLTGSKAYQNMNGNVLFEEMCVNRILLFFQNDTDFLEIGNDSVGHGGNLFSREGTGVVGEGQAHRDGRVFARVIAVATSIAAAMGAKREVRKLRSISIPGNLLGSS